MTERDELSDLIAALNDALNATNSLHCAAERWLHHEVLPKIFRADRYAGGEAAKALATVLQVTPEVAATLERTIKYLRGQRSAPR